MRRIVLLSNRYLNIPSANGICARNLVNTLRNKGHEVFVICYENKTLIDEIDQEYIYTIPEPNQNIHHNTIEKVIRTIQVMSGSTKPIIDEELTDTYYKSLCTIDGRKKIDAIIAVYFPFESVEAMRRFAIDRKDVKTFIFELDSVGDGVSKKHWLYDIYNWAYEKWLNKVYSQINYIFIMQSHVDYWKARFGAHYSNKMVPSDIPVLVEKHSTPKAQEKSIESIKMIYSGLIEKRYRSPSYLLSVLEMLSRRIDYEFAFYSKGDCEDEIAKVKSKVQGIHQCGYVTPNELDRAISESDFLVSIGNSVSRSVPSKIISYLGYGKPIIHFSSQENDVCNEYLREYPLSLIINSEDSIEISVQRITDFISLHLRDTVDFSLIQKIYYENTPEYSCDLISSILR